MLAIGAATSSNAIGRYQVANGPGFVTIIDTSTGRAWGATVASVVYNHPGFWEPKVDQ